MLSDEVKHTAIGNYPSDRLVVFSAVMLQRDKMIRKVRDIRKLLVRRLDMWLMLQGKVRPAVRWLTDKVGGVLDKVRAAMRWITDRPSGGVLLPTDEIVTVRKGKESRQSVFEALKSKHPQSHPPFSTSLLSVNTLPMFEDVDITGAHINRVANMIQGSPSPGGCDSSHWQDILIRFGHHSDKLRDAVANLARVVVNTIVPWENIRTLLANRLIALDKCPGIRPIGIGEILRRIISKSVCLVAKSDVEDVCGSAQLCAGVNLGIEGAIHAIHDLYNENHENDWGILMIDATNAFNSINWVSLLWNARILRPTASQFLFNCYKGWACLVLSNYSEYIYSREGVTQGDPISMLMYAIGTIPLIRQLSIDNDWTQVWYADDSSVCGKLTSVRAWFDLLTEVGPRFGYFPEPSKSYLIINDCCTDMARDLFHDSQINNYREQ